MDLIKLCVSRARLFQTSPVDEPEDDEQRLRGLPDEELKAEFETYRALVNPSTHGGYAPHGHTDALIDECCGGNFFCASRVLTVAECGRRYFDTDHSHLSLGKHCPLTVRKSTAL